MPRSTYNHITLSRNGKESAMATVSNARYGVKHTENHKRPQLKGSATLGTPVWNAFHTNPSISWITISHTHMLEQRVNQQCGAKTRKSSSLLTISSGLYLVIY